MRVHTAGIVAEFQTYPCYKLQGHNAMTTSLELMKFALCFTSQSLASLHATSWGIQMFGKQLAHRPLENCVLCNDISAKPGKKVVQVPSLNGCQKKEWGLQTAEKNQPARAMIGSINLYLPALNSSLTALTCQRRTHSN